MLNCRHTSRLLSKSLDQPLPLWDELALRMHLLMCGACNRFERQLRFLRKALAALDAKATMDGGIKLSDQARERIKRVLRGNSRDDSAE